MFDNGALMFGTKWAGSQLVTNNLSAANALLAHLTSKESTLSQEYTDFCVQRMVLIHADIVKDTQDKKLWPYSGSRRRPPQSPVFMRIRSTVPPCQSCKPSSSVSTARFCRLVLLYIRRAVERLPVSQLQEFSTRRSKMCLTYTTVPV